MNLTYYNVEEISSIESKEIEGGFLVELAIVCVIIGGLIGYFTNTKKEE